MDVVVRTPHGDADVTIVSAATTTTLGDVMGYVTGQAVPRVVEVDGHPVDASTLVSEASLVMGSMLATHPPRSEPTGREDVNLLQLTGPGAGAVRRLEGGRYRVGPGRRLSATELDDAVVESPCFELVVDAGGVTVSAIKHGAATVMLAGSQVRDPAPWTHGELVVGRRMFALEAPASTRPERALGRADADGTIAYSRSPCLDRDQPHLLVVDAVRAATEANGGLWSRRPTQARSFEIPFGIVDDQPRGALSRLVSIDLDADNAIAVVGTDRFRTALARTLLVEAAALHGPADLDIAIATGPDRLGSWDWAKWLPHVRLDGAPALFSSDHELAAWAASFVQSPGPRLGPNRWANPHVSLLVIDDSDLWTRRDSPLRELLAAPPPELRIIALCARAERAPARCSTVISQTGSNKADSRAGVPEVEGDTVSLDLLARSRQVRDILPALVEPDIALLVARSMAPLGDSELPWRRPSETSDMPTRTLVDVLGLTGASPTTIRERWGASDQGWAEGLRLPIGLVTTGEPMEITFAPGTNVLISGPTDTDVASVAVCMLHALAATVSPSSMPILHLTSSETSIMSTVLANLPHAAGRAVMSGIGAMDRILVRLERVLETGQAVVVVVEALDAVPFPAALVEQLHEISEHFASLHVLTLATTTSASAPIAGNTAIASAAEGDGVRLSIDRRAGHLQGVARIDGPGGTRTGMSFHPFEPSAALLGPDGAGSDGAGSDLVIRPLVFGRALTPLERRLAVPNSSRRTVELDPTTAVLADAIRGAAHAVGGVLPVLLPRPLPTTVDLATLLAEHPGDAAPFALTDAADRATIDVAWWESGPSGSLLMLGSPRSGVDAVLSALIVGISERFSPEDLRVYAVDPLPRRVAAIESLPHVGATASPDRLDDAVAVIESVAAIVADRRAGSAPAHDRAGIVLLLHDLSHLGRRLFARNHTGVIDAIRTIAGGGDVGVNIVATATRPADSMGLVPIVSDVIVGQMSHADDYAELGLDASISSGLGAHRCWSMTSEHGMQLAVLDRSLAETIGYRQDLGGDESG